MTMITQTKQIGRPAKWTSPEVLMKLIMDYWEKCKAEKEPFTLSGLAVELDTTRQGLINYGMKDGFLDAIKKARALAESTVEKHLMSGKPPVGAIFVAKNNFGWVDKHEIEHSGKVGIARVIDRLESNHNIIEGQIQETDLLSEGEDEDEEMAQ